MPDAGWYPDPADPTRERWWGGVEWTHEVRAVVAAPVMVPPAPQAPLLDVPGGGINPFAAHDALATQQQALSRTYEQEPVFVRSMSSELSQQMVYYRPPRNTMATLGLVFSLLILVPVPSPFNIIMLVWPPLGLIFSIIGLVNASRFRRSGRKPSGRKRGIFGVILSVLIPAALTALALSVYFVGQLAAQQTENEVAQALVDDKGAPLVDLLGGPPIYDRASLEQGFLDTLDAQAGRPSNWVEAPTTWIECPDHVDLVVGGVIECEFGYEGRTHQIRYTFIDVHGNGVTQVDGMVVEQ